jgi:1-acyl-sn-glycerol-3-phosphate acyltransferase
MRRVRVALRLVLAVGNSLFHALVLLTGRLFLLPFPRLDARWRMFVMRLWSGAMLLILRVRVDLQGRAPEPPFLLVSNHLSYLDIPLLGRYTGAAFIAKSEIGGWPLIGFLCRIVHTIFIDRSIRRDLTRVMAEIHSELDKGMGIVLFAEGTSSKGATLLPFRPSLLEVAVRSGIPVSYAALSYRTESDDPPAHDAVCWWGGAAFAPHVLEMGSLRRIHARVVFGEECVHDEDRKRLAERLREEIGQIFEPVVSEEQG